MSFKEKKILITAGPTYEAIDPVRFIGNRSTGKMGIAIAERFAEAGAEVILVLGPTHLRPKNPAIKLVSVETGAEMYDACLKNYEDSDIVIMSAAVADYKPLEVAEQKIKKSDTTLTLQLVKTTDILFELGKLKNNQFLVGFALETENLIENATKKLQKKNLDLIVANNTNSSGEGFGFDTNKVIMIDRNNNLYNFELKQKEEVASDILSVIEKCLEKK
ncbi:MAG: bifunctional phosphopantothenoylcysteine decarboxylase/phosphopantothenate--cysteine ligase CoaBC [Bacteroidota bacterium]|nr:bifunctional phosphopantothenoylcysteine decarboxylase/phosphopantothenate--cysteine ligase CoaBC [Bacteroidota bacterium]